MGVRSASRFALPIPRLRPAEDPCSGYGVLQSGVPVPAPNNDREPLPVRPWEQARVFVAGHKGLVGSALCRRLAREPCDILTVDRQQLDLRHAASVDAWVAESRPDYAILAAATVGGIADNAMRPADYLADNLAIALNVINACWKHDVERLVFLGSSCIYPGAAVSPIAESALMAGPLEVSNEAYAIAKIAGLKFVQAMRRQYGADFISLMPTNLYGPFDRFDEERGHVIPALIARFERARRENWQECVVWGTGLALREFMHSDDCADAIVHALQFYDGDDPLNIGSGEEVSIATLARMIARAVGYDGRIVFDVTQLSGTPRKLLDSSRMQALGWRPRIDLKTGLAQTVAWWRKNALDRTAEAPDGAERV